MGLGLIGQLAARLAMAAGCDVAGIDPAGYPRASRTAAGVLALDERGAETTDQVLAWSRGRGADAVLVCAAGPSPGAVMRVPALCRDRAAVVIVGDVGLQLNRTPFYERELSLRFARSYGPGRYDPSYEAWGVDYPAGQVRWSEGRNFEAVLDLLAAGRLVVGDLVTHTFDIGRAAEAYRLIEERSEPYLAIRLDYPDCGRSGRSPVRVRQPRCGSRRPAAADARRRLGRRGRVLHRHAAARPPGRGLQPPGRGGLGRRPVRRRGPRSGTASRRRSPGPTRCSPTRTCPSAVIATPHDTHASLAVRALTAGRHVWCEKPLALTEDELDAVRAAWRESGRVLAIGFNRRWSPAVAAARRALAGVAAAKLVVYRVAAGPVPPKHWYHDRRQGGRLLGEVCHFVDTAQALVGAPIEDVTALPGGGPGGPADDAVVALRFADGSLATIGYGSAAALGRQGMDRGARGRAPDRHRRLPVGHRRRQEAVEGPPGQGASGPGGGLPAGGGGRGRPADRGHARHDARHDPGRNGSGAGHD